MNVSVLTVIIRREHDVVLARQRARQIARLLGFEGQDEVRIATAVSEIARNAFQYAGGGKVEYSYTGVPVRQMLVRVSDEGKGIADLQAVLGGEYTSRTGMGLGILGARRLMDSFEISSGPGRGTTVLIGKKLTAAAPEVTPATIRTIADALVREAVSDPLSELQRQNQELLSTLERLEERQQQLAMVNKELEDTNRGVVALYAELDERADALRRTSDLKTQFLSNMSHEFRTPLNSVLSLSHILLDQLDDGGRLRTPRQRPHPRPQPGNPARWPGPGEIQLEAPATNSGQLPPAIRDCWMQGYTSLSPSRFSFSERPC